MPSGQRKKSITFGRNNRAVQKLRMLRKANEYRIKMSVGSVDLSSASSAIDASSDEATRVWKTPKRKTRDALSPRQR
jgi:hypothetical protein